MKRLEEWMGDSELWKLRGSVVALQTLAKSRLIGQFEISKGRNVARCKVCGELGETSSVKSVSHRNDCELGQLIMKDE